MKTHAQRHRILAGGSLDLDNLGDLLFFLLTEQYLPAADLIPSGPFGWNMEPILGRPVRRYAPALANETFDAVWTVGGEIGGTSTLHDAFRLSAPDDLYNVYKQSSEEGRQGIIEHYIGDIPAPPSVHAYIPPQFAYPLNANIPTVINSVGISGLLKDASQRRARLNYLRNLTLASVRDRESSDLLTSIGVRHTLAPDAIHALPLTRPYNEAAKSDIAIFQIATPVLEELGIANVAAELSANKHLSHKPLRLLMTGTWRGGADSATHHRQLAGSIKKANPRADVELITDRRPDDLVHHIRTARIVIGTSLHLRIIAAAYNVPRVTLAIHYTDKPTRYARLWDRHMPFEVPLDGIHTAIATALANARDPLVTEDAHRNTELAHQNLKDLTARLMELLTDAAPVKAQP